MSFTRLNYDDDSYKHSLRESVYPGAYMLKAPRNDCDDGCFYPAPEIALASTGAALCEKDLVDVDSELIGITRKASHCPTNQYLPSDKPFCQAKPLKDCYGLNTEPTRISNGPCTLRGIPNGWNRWEWLCMNPQDKALIPFDYNINNRTIVKDNHRPCVNKPIDQSCALPPADNMNVCYDWSSKWSGSQYTPKIDAQHPPSWVNTICPKIPAL